MDRKVLGKGLSALIPEKEATTNTTTTVSDPNFVKVSDIVQGSLQPRVKFSEEELQSLAESIRSQGVIQPLIVRKHMGRLELIAGERRLRAVKMLGLEEVPVVIRENLTDSQVLQMALIENIQRENLSPIEEARAYLELSEKFSLSQEAIATAVGKDRSSITNTLRLLKLPLLIQNAIRDKVITAGHARAILSIMGEAAQTAFFKTILKKGLSVRQAEAKARAAKTNIVPKSAKKAEDPHISAIEEALQRALGTKVKVQHSKNRGKILIEYYSDSDLTRLARKLGMQHDAI